MNERDFAYWLNGFAELTGDTPPTVEQWKSIREHLTTVFVKVTPPVNAGANTHLDKVIRQMQDNWHSRSGGANPAIQDGTGAIC